MKRIINIIINNVFYYLILIFCIVIIISILYQKFFLPNDIPNIFGWKIFMVMNENMTDEIKSGDLVFVKNTNINNLKENDYIALKSNSNRVSFYKISKYEHDSGRGDKTGKLFLDDQEKSYTLSKINDNYEGVYKYRIPKLGYILLFILKPVVMISIFLAILILGLLWIHIAGELDKKDSNKLNS